MPSVYDIKKAARKADVYKDNINSKKRNMNYEVNSLRSWWDSEASRSFVNSYSRIDNDIRKIEKSIENVEYYLNRLAKAVEDAENEKRLKIRKAGK